MIFKIEKHRNLHGFIITLAGFLIFYSCEVGRDLLEVLRIIKVVDENTISLKVMSFNILNSEKSDSEEGVQNVRSWNNREALVADIIRTSNADIVGLQEVTERQRSDLNARLSNHYDHFGKSTRGGTDGTYKSIFFLSERFDLDEHGTFWFSNRPDDTGTRPGRKWGNPKHRRICTWGRFFEKSTGKGFYVYNLHLSNDRGADHPKLNRRKSVVLLQERIQNRNHPSEPYVVTGDFNAPPWEESSIGLMLGREFLVEVNLTEISSDLPNRTISWTVAPLFTSLDTWFEKHSQEPDATRINYIFVQENSIVHDAKIIRVSQDGFFPSDHFPITATVLLPYGN